MVDIITRLSNGSRHESVDDCRSAPSPRHNDGARTGSGICSSTASLNPRRRCPHLNSSRRGSSTVTHERIGTNRAESLPRK